MQVVAEISNQVIDIAGMHGAIIATKAAKAKAKAKVAGLSAADRLAARDALATGDNSNLTPTEADIQKYVYQTSYDKAYTQALNSSGFGTGGAIRQGIMAVSAAVQGMAGGNVAQAIAGAAAPYLATEIKKATTDAKGNVNIAANAVAHAVLGGIVAEASGNSALACAAGAATGELAARVIADRLYPGKAISEMTESEKQTVTTLSLLAGGLAAGTAGDSTSNAVAGAQAGRNAVENNALSSKDEKQRQDAKWSLPYIKDEKQKQQADKLISELNEKDELFNAAIDAACKNLSSAACQGMRQELSAMAKSYDEQMDGQYIGTMRSVYGDGAKQVDGLMWQYATADMKAQREADIIRLMDKGISREVAEGLSLGMRTVHGLAAIGGAVYGMKGTGVAGESAGTIRNVNLGYPVSDRTHNCVNCSIATDATLAGNPASALPIYSTKGVPLPVLEKHYGTKFKYVSSTENIIQQMTNAGSGSRGIVYGSYGVGQPGHVFNVVNQNGVVRFLDGQSGKAADLGQFKSFQLLRTNK